MHATGYASLQNLLLLLPLLLSPFLLGYQCAIRPHNLRPKVFVIGLSKTGTTSLGDALAILGYKRLGWKDIRSRHLVHAWHNRDLDSILERTAYYDTFEDLPWPFLYREMAERFPDAKFILSLRRDEQTWLESMRRHVGRARWVGYEYCYGASSVEGNEQTVLARYSNHTTEVRQYFEQQPQRLLELDIDNGEANWAILCSFVDCKALPKQEFPRSNSAASWGDDSLYGMLRSAWSMIIILVEESCARMAYGNGPEHRTTLLSALWNIVSVCEQAGCDLGWRATTALTGQATAVVSN